MTGISRIGLFTKINKLNYVYRLLIKNHVSIHILFSDLYVVAIDWPGQGMSSPRPAGSYYHMFNYVADLRYVIDGTYVCMSM